MLDFAATVRSRQSIRKFLPTPMTEEQIMQVLEDAQNAPSACNTQPWMVHVVSGKTLERLLAVFRERFAAKQFSPDFEFDQSKYKGEYEKRWRNQYARVFMTSFGIPREDKAGRSIVYEQNIVGYGAPHMAQKSQALREAFGVEVLANSLYVERTGSTFQALSAEGSTLDGLNVHLGIIDELHAHKTRDVYDVVETATGKRKQSLIWVITTAGSNRAGICYEVRGFVCKVLRSGREDSRSGGRRVRQSGHQITSPCPWRSTRDAIKKGSTQGSAIKARPKE